MCIIKTIHIVLTMPLLLLFVVSITCEKPLECFIFDSCDLGRLKLLGVSQLLVGEDFPTNR